MAHVRIWKFRPPPDREREFAEAYSETGEWGRLFRNAAGFHGTTLLEPTEVGGWWLTIDRWDSASSFDAFTEAFGEQYRALDKQPEGVAGEEQFVGAFED
jgi:heme-degrading monooxygenase HmoA